LIFKGIALQTTIAAVIPTFNRASLVSRALDSVMRQTFLPSEIIVVDDGSTDNTENLISEKYHSVSYLKTENKGVSAARNIGIKATKSEWIAFLDSDDEWLPQKLEKQIAKVSNKHSYKIVHCEEIWIRNGRRVNPKIKHKKYGGYIFEKCLPLCVISPSAVVIHRDLFQELGYFDETLPACEDYDLWLRICAKYPVLFVDEPLIKKFGGHDDQLSKRFWGMDRFRVEALHKILTLGKLTESQKQKATEMLINKCSILINGFVKRGNYQAVQKYKGLVGKV
tara:strand:- start:15 stop:857 length:843 start_codon:yes stop_codon:yes gene_type:complete